MFLSYLQTLKTSTTRAGITTRDGQRHATFGSPPSGIFVGVAIVPVASAEVGNQYCQY